MKPLEDLFFEKLRKGRCLSVIIERLGHSDSTSEAQVRDRICSYPSLLKSPCVHPNLSTSFAVGFSPQLLEVWEFWKFLCLHKVIPGQICFLMMVTPPADGGLPHTLQCTKCRRGVWGPPLTHAFSLYRTLTHPLEAKKFFGGGVKYRDTPARDVLN